MDLSVTGGVLSLGAAGVGIMALSIADECGTADAIMVPLRGGDFVSGGADVVGVALVGGAQNILPNVGFISTTDGVADLAANQSQVGDAFNRLQA